MLTGYLAAEGYEKIVEQQLTKIEFKLGRLFVVEGLCQGIYFAQNVWQNIQIIPFTSISDAAKKLKELGKLWAFYPHSFIRRGTLISEKLPYFKPKSLAFPSKIPSTPLGSWTLLNENTILASNNCSSPFAHGEVSFLESKIPPSRAYLKLWEALTLIGKFPGLGDSCLEIGACPGSWTWALSELGCKVVAVDKAPVEDFIAASNGVTFLKKDAFALSPSDFDKLDWIFSDVICYPEKLLDWIKEWLLVHPKANFVCTIKFQGESDYEIVEKFLEIQGSKVCHLFNNKHELTFILINH